MKKDNIMTRKCHNCSFLETVSFKKHEEFNYEFNFLNMLQKTTFFCQINSYGIPQIILHEF